MSGRRGKVTTGLRWLLIVLLSATVRLAYGETVSAADPSREAVPRIRRLFVPVDAPRRWPAGEWRPLPLADFERRLAEVRPHTPSPDRAVITRAVYSATLVHDQFRGGHCEWQIKRTGAAPALLSLESWNMAVSELAWKDGTALWGSDPRGRSVLIVDRPAGTIVGTWSLPARTLPQGREFSLGLPPATVTRLDLRLPAGQTLQCSQGDVSGPVPAETGWSNWRIDLGSRNHAQLVITRPTASPRATRPLLITRRDMAYAVRPEAVRLQTDFKLEVLEAPIRELKWRASSDLKVIGMTLGDNTSLAWTETTLPTGRFLSVKLADPLEGPGILVRIQALTSPQTEHSWALPQLRLVDAIHIDGQVSINVFPPLELADFQIEGYRQTALLTSSSDGETVVLRQLQPEGEAQILLAPPRFQARGRLLTDVQTWGPSWSSSTQFELSTPSGSSFSVQCGLPPDWEVTEVREVENDPAGSMISWELLRRTGSAPILRVEFREALSPDRPQRFQVLCRTPAAGLRKQVAVPLFASVGGAELEQFVSISTESTASPALERGVQVEAISAVDFPTDAAAQTWRKTASGSFPGGLLLKSRGPTPTGSFLLQAVRDLADVQALVLAEVTQQRIVEKFQLQIIPRNAPLKRVLVYFNQGNSGGEPPTWSTTVEPKRKLEAQRLESSTHAAWNLPESGELWEVRLAASTAAEFTLLGARSRPLNNSDHLTLIHVPHANLFDGRIQVDHDPTLSLRLEPRNLEPVVESTGDGKNGPAAAVNGRRQAWRYREVTSELACQVAQELQNTSLLAVSSLELAARLSLDSSGSDLYWATFRLSEFSEGHAFRWTLPEQAALLQVTRDGLRAVPDRVGSGWMLLLAERRATQTVLVQYSVPATARFGPNGRQLALPGTPHALLRFDLQVFLPETIRFDASRSNIRWAEVIESSGGWRNVLFGPFGRPAPVLGFHPLSIADWSGTERPGRSRGDDSPVEETTSPLAGAERNAMVSGLPQQGGWPSQSSSGGWQVLRYTAPIVPNEVRLVLWSSRDVWQLCCITLIVVVVLGAILRARRVRSAGIWGTLALSLTVFFAVCFRGVAAEIAGSGSLAVLIVCLLPQRWLVWSKSGDSQRTPRVPAGSTRSFQHPFPQMLLLLPALLLSAAATAGLAGEENSASSTTTRSTPLPVGGSAFDVLIPVDKEGKPAGTTPLVYLPPTLHEWFLAKRTDDAEIPDYLLTAADYSGRVVSGQPFTVRAKYEVLVLATQPEIRVQFPFRGANLGGDDACLVEGKPQAVLPADAGSGCALLLAGAATEPVGGAASTKTVPLKSDPPSIPFRRIKVEFRLHPNVVTREDVSAAACGVPSLLAAAGILAVESPQPNSWSKSQSKAGFAVPLGTPASPAEPQRIAYGKEGDLLWQWSPKTPSTVAAIETQWRFSAVLDIDPMLVQYHCRMQGRPSHGAISSLRWKLPPGMTVRSLQGDDLLEWHLESLQEGLRALWVTCNRPQAGPFNLQAELVLPIHSGGGGTLIIPRLPVPICGDPAPGPARISLYQLALRPPADFKMPPPNPAKSHILSAEEFQKEQPVDGSRPFTSYQLDEPGEISLRLETLRPQMQAESTTIYRLSRDRLDLNYAANIDTRGAPGFRYRLQVDPRLRITNISVIEEGAERLLRWNSAPNGQILVFLNDRTTRGQVLRVDAHLPLTVPARLELPRVQLKYADQREDHISVYHDAALNVRLEGTAGLRSLPEDPAEQFPSGRELPLGRFALPQGDTALHATIASNSPDIVADRLFLLNTQEKPWKLTARLRLRIERGRGSEFQVVVPREWVPVGEVHTEPASRQVPSLQSDGSLRLLLIPEEPVSATFVVTLRLPISPRLGINWALPVIEVPGARRGQTFVLTPSRGSGGGVKAAGRTLDRVDAISLPAVLRSLLPDPPTGTEWLGTQVDVFPVRLQFPNSTTANGGPRRVMLSESQVLLAPEKSYGRQVLWLPPESARQLELNWPSMLEPVAVLVDGVVSPFSRPQQDRLTIPLHVGPAGQTVLIGWTAPGFQPTDRSGVESLPLPSPRAAKIEFDLVEVFPPAGFRLRSDDDRLASSAGGMALNRWEGLLRWQDVQLGVNISDEQVNAADQLIRGTAATTERLFRRWQRHGGTSITSADLQRFRELQRHTREFLPDGPSGDFSRPSPSSLPLPELPPALMVGWPAGNVPWDICRVSQSTGETEPVRIAYAARGTFPWIGAIMAGLLAGGGLLLLSRQRVLRWIQHREGVSLGALGLLWWQCLLAGGAGFMLMLVGLLLAIFQLRRRPAASAPPRSGSVLKSPLPG